MLSTPGIGPLIELLRVLLKQRCEDLGVKSGLIMCDHEGDLGDPKSAKRTKAVENHYKWVEAAKFLGWTELAMHGAFLVPAVAAVLGTFFLAQRLSGSPLLGALLMLFTPVFLVSATTVMCDVWLLALWVWSVDCWLRGLERDSYWLLLLASLLAAAAGLLADLGPLGGVVQVPGRAKAWATSVASCASAGLTTNGGCSPRRGMAQRARADTMGEVRQKMGLR